MALTKVTSEVIQAGAITSDKIAENVALGVKIANVSIANSTYSVLDDTAVNVGGGYIVVTGAGFQSGAEVIINDEPATSTTFVSSTELRAQVPAKAAATYTVFVVNPDGGSGTKPRGITYSGTPTWVTASTLANVINVTAFTGLFEATGATSYSNTTALPSGFNLVSANGYYYGNIEVENETTYNFTIRATDAELQDSPRTFSLTAKVVLAPTSVDVLLVAGGGGGGWGGSGGGGAGAGGVVYESSISVSGGTPYTVTVGAGGAGSASRYSNLLNPGGNSSFHTATIAIGGGGGSSAGPIPGPVSSVGGNGGSGGGGAQRYGAAGGKGVYPGSSYINATRQGYDGGAAGPGTGVDAGGGGGGAGGAGGNSPSSSPNATIGGPGGPGSSAHSSLLTIVSAGVDVGGTRYIAGGGGGASTGLGGLGGGGAGAAGPVWTSETGQDGTTYTGGGGGGSNFSGTRGGNGASGIIIIRYADTFGDASVTTGSPTYTNTGGYKYYKFTGSGSITW